MQLFLLFSQQKWLPPSYLRAFFFYPSDCIPQNQFPSASSPSNENILMILFYFSFLPSAGLSADSSFDSDLHPRRSDQAHHLSSQEPAAASVRTEELWVCLPHPWGESQRSSPTLQQHLHSVPEDSGESQTGTGWCCCVHWRGAVSALLRDLGVRGGAEGVLFIEDVYNKVVNYLQLKQGFWARWNIFQGLFKSLVVQK